MTNSKKTPEQVSIQPLNKIVLEPIKRNNYSNLERASVQEAVISAVQSNPKRFIEDYNKLDESFGGRYIGADLFKETFSYYNASKENRNLFNNVVHNSAAVLSSAQYKLAIEDNKHPERDTVVFLTGVPGAGKTSTVLVNGEPDKRYRAIFEGQLSNKDTTIPKIQSALDAGLKVEIMVVHASAENALDNTLKRFKEVGRGASVGTMANIQGNLPEGLEAVRNEFGNKVKLNIIDVRDRTDVKALVGWNNLPVLKSEGNAHDLKEKLTARIEQYREQGKINEPAYHQAIGNEPKRSYGRVDAESNYWAQENDRGRGVSQKHSETPNLAYKAGKSAVSQDSSTQLAAQGDLTPYRAAKLSASQATPPIENKKNNEVVITPSDRTIGRSK